MLLFGDAPGRTEPPLVREIPISLRSGRAKKMNLIPDIARNRQLIGLKFIPKKAWIKLETKIKQLPKD